jgi:hypothetical protein
MKKKLLGLMLVSILVLGSFQAAMASTLAQTLKCYGNGSVCLMTLQWTATVSTGAFTATALTAAKMTTLAGYYLYEMETVPGGTTPQDNYDVTITSTATGYSKDILGGAGTDRSSTLTQSVYPKNTDTFRFPPVGGDTWTLGITGNNVSLATGTIRLWFVK